MLNYSLGSDGVVNQISVQKRSTIEPPARTKRKSKIITTTGAAGVIGGKKPSPVSKKAQAKAAPKNTNKKKTVNKKKTTKTTRTGISTRYTRVANHERDNLFYSDNSHWEF